MASFAETIKKAVHTTVSNMPLADFKTGVVVSTSPLRIRISDRITLEEVHLYVLKSAEGKYSVNVGGASGVAMHTLKENDMVMLGRLDGGEKFVVLGQVIKL